MVEDKDIEERLPPYHRHDAGIRFDLLGYAVVASVIVVWVIWGLILAIETRIKSG